MRWNVLRVHPPVCIWQNDPLPKIMARWHPITGRLPLCVPDTSYDTLSMRSVSSFTSSPSSWASTHTGLRRRIDIPPYSPILPEKRIVAQQPIQYHSELVVVTQQSLRIRPTQRTDEFEHDLSAPRYYDGLLILK